jgi:membrane protease YdiL (CAAX protease family)
MSEEFLRSLRTGGPGPLPSRREQTVEVLVFLFMIVPSVALSFFVVKAGTIGFVLTAVATMFRDLGLVALILFFLWRNGESLAHIGWSFKKRALDVVLGFALFPFLVVGSGVLEEFLHGMGFTSPATPLPALHPTPNVFHLVLGTVFVAVVAISEETIFRGYLLLRLQNTTRSVAGAVLLSAVIFSIGHGYEGSAGVITVGAMGVVFALAYLWRRSLVLPVTLHFLQDFMSIVLLPLLSRKP